MANLIQLNQVREYFLQGHTRPYSFRKEQLLKLQSAVIANEAGIFEALKQDLKKSKEESWVTENGFLLTEISNAIKNLARWMERKRVPTNLLNLPSKSFLVAEPLGVVLIISPWNYPFQLLLTPLVGAIAAGNCVVLKPSEFAPATSAIIRKIIEETFDPGYILYTEGEGSKIIPEMLGQFIFDHVFYTGSTSVGKIIYQHAAEHLVPVTLELGGKSPCIVEADADITVAARRITMPKFSNAGQMCVAPDYVLVHSSRKQELVDGIIENIRKFFGADASSSADFGRIINARQFDRLTALLVDEKIIYGGNHDRNSLYISPTLVEANAESAFMKDEIFGPILPILTFKTHSDALQILSRHKNPLAFYVFTSSKANEQFWIENVPFGGGCINNASWHLTNHHLPFGGRGFSGMGNYHGKFTFNTFSHIKGIMKTPTWFDPSVKYPPFKGKLNLFKKIIGR